MSVESLGSLIFSLTEPWKKKKTLFCAHVDLKHGFSAIIDHHLLQRKSTRYPWILWNTYRETFGNDHGGTVGREKCGVHNGRSSSRHALHLSGSTTEALHAVGHTHLGDGECCGAEDLGFLGGMDIIFEGIYVCVYIYIYIYIYM